MDSATRRDVGRDGRPSFLQRLHTLQAFYSTLPGDAPKPAARILEPVLALRGELGRDGCRIVFFGAVKTGKTSLVNRLLGADVLPTHSFRTNRYVTVVEHGPTPEALLVMGAGTDQHVQFDDVRAVLLDRAAGNEAVQKVRIAVPLPILAWGVSLVDTPGLLNDEASTDAVYREIERADLAIMVLAADKILSAEERAVAAHVHDLLHGNIVFVVNRLDLIDEEDREDVLAWASAGLRGTGNPLVGAPRIVGESNVKRSRTERMDIEAWLTEFVASERRERACVLSRASILEHRLAQVLPQIQEERARAASRADEARRRHLESVMGERATMRRTVGEGRRRLETVRTGMRALQGQFVERCVHDTEEQLGRRPHAGPVRLQLETAVDGYAAAVRDHVAGALLGVPVTVTRFDLSSWIFRLDVEAEVDPLRRIGTDLGDLLTRPIDRGKRGREAGALLGSWIGKNVLGKDAEGATEKKIENMARTVVVSIDAEAQRYLSEVFTLLDDADTFYTTWTRPSAEVDAAEEEERRWSALLHWCEGFRHAAGRMVKEALTTS